MLDVSSFLPKIAKYYATYKPFLHLLGLTKEIPPQVDLILTQIAQGQEPSPEQLKKLVEGEFLQPQVGEPVGTRQLIIRAYHLHYDGYDPLTNKDYGMPLATRTIAEIFTQEGNPCSHATVARWINSYDYELRTSKLEFIKNIAKYIIITIFWISSLLLFYFILT